MDLGELLDDMRGYRGLGRKRAVGRWAAPFTGRLPVPPLLGDIGGYSTSKVGIGIVGPGDDAGALPFGGGYLLLAGEGLWPPLLADPYFAGLCAVAVNVNDIYAMGGRPLGMVLVVFEGTLTEGQSEGFIRGLVRGVEHYRVPLLGGHTTPEGEAPAVAVSIVGFAKRLLLGNSAQTGQRIIVALDLEGRRHPDFPAWDAVTGADSLDTLSRLEVIARIGEMGLASACRDISNPGLLGTAAMMMEASGKGALIVLDEVPAPPGLDMLWWLKAYPSYGFLLTVDERDEGKVVQMLGAAGVAWADIGRVEPGSRIMVEWQGEQGEFLDWRSEPVTGLFS